MCCKCFLYNYTSISIFVQFEFRIQQLYGRTDIVGKMSKIYFAAPLSPSKIPSSPLRPEVLESLRTPRISLRFLASYQTLLYLGIMYIFLRLSFGFGTFGYLLVLGLCILLYGFFGALTMKQEVKVDWDNFKERFYTSMWERVSMVGRDGGWRVNSAI